MTTVLDHPAQQQRDELMHRASGLAAEFRARADDISHIGWDPRDARTHAS